MEKGGKISEIKFKDVQLLDRETAVCPSCGKVARRGFRSGDDEEGSFDTERVDCPSCGYHGAWHV